MCNPSSVLRFAVLVLSVALTFSFAAAPASLAQVVSTNGGSIEGLITDASGAIVPGAAVVIADRDSGFSKSVVTDKAGLYSVGPLAPGNYSVTVTAAGFSTLKVDTVVRTGTATSGSFKLTVGSAAQTVEVQASALQVDTDQPGVSDVITTAQIESLPVNGRNFLDLAQIEPGVILQAGSSFDPTKAGYSAISVGGVSGRTTRILLDGQDITDENVGTTLMNVSQGAIGDFQLNRSTQDASGEVTSTGQVLVSTRSGTNKYHGMAFYNFQDYRALFANANTNGVTSTGAPLPPPYFQRNNYGGSVGGPVFHDKLFFFANAERIQQAALTPSNVGAAFLPTAGLLFPTIGTPYKLTYSTGRLDYNGPLGGHYFFRAAYNVDAATRNPSFYELYANRDNTYGFAGGADFQRGHFTHSFRGSYEKFHNFIADSVAGNSGIYDPAPGLTLSYTGNIAFGPNGNVPQATYQSDKQFRYDGSWTTGRHLIRYGYSINRILGGGFFAADSLSPIVSITAGSQLNGTGATAANPSNFGCNGVVGALPCLGDPLKGYNTSALTIGNGLGGENEFPGFGLANGGQFDWREGAYIQDNWKATPSLGVTAGLRWSVDTGRANQDLAPLLCSDIDPNGVGSVVYPTACGSPSTTIFSLFNADPAYNGKVKQPYANFAPQAGVTFAPGNHKTVYRAGAGIFYENDVFNNAINVRGGLLKRAYGFATNTTVCSAYSLNLPDGHTILTHSPDGTDLNTLCHEPVAQAYPQFIALKNLYQANQAANPTSPTNPASNGSFIGTNLTIAGQNAPNYRTPYSEQYNVGVQREIFHGAIISVDYVHNTTLKIGQVLDQNHVGAARTFNLANAQAAINATFVATCKAATVGGVVYTVPTSVQAAIAPGGCSGGSGSGTGGKFATIKDFATNGLDSGVTFNSGNPASYSKKYPLTPGMPAKSGAIAAVSAFPGLNPQLGRGRFTMPIGRSHYDALQVVFKQQAQHPVPGITSSNFQVSYNLSRIVATTTSSDEFFSPGVLDNDNPALFMGRSALDHTNQISFGGSAILKYGPRIALLAHFFSASPSTMTLDTTSLANGQIFQSDLTGDGITGDPAPGTVAGTYMHGVKPTNLGAFITNYNNTVANTLTPAGKAVAASGLITQAQLIQMGAAVQPIAQLPQTNGVFNPAYRQIDAQVSYPMKLNWLVKRLPEVMTLEPVIAFYNAGNFSNFTSDTSVLQNTTAAGATNSSAAGYGNITGLNNLNTQGSKRTVRGIGTFDQGAQRTVEYQLHLNF
jgi:hypothetical protein